MLKLRRCGEQTWLRPVELGEDDCQHDRLTAVHAGGAATFGRSRCGRERG